MKKATLLLSLLLIFSCVSCGQRGSREDFSALHKAFLERGKDVGGYEVSEIEAYDTMEFFCVRVCLNTDDAQTVDDFVWFEANVLYFESQEEAQAVYDRNQSTGIGGTCLAEGNVLIYWLSNDPFEDLYKEVFTSVFGR